MSRSHGRFARDLAAGLRAASRLLTGHEQPINTLPADAPGLRHSFAAAAFCLPVAGFIRWLTWRDQGAPAALWHAIGVNLALFVIGWAGFLLLARLLLRGAGLLPGWSRLLVVWNWCNVSQYALLLGANLADLLGAGANLLNVLGLVTLFWASWIEWRALRPALGGNGLRAAGLTALDAGTGLIVQAIAAGLGS